uniref:Uncharacterized protein n=1 Tax=Vitis vinifera TaxID=29760 RepID=A5BGI4_VITVI|nr:hypothetical protein VITISV_037276 [Vitis vinifera]
MLAPRTEREVRGFLGRLQYISRFIARLTDICEPIFRLLRKSQPTVWDDRCQCAFERIREYLLSPLVLAALIPGRPLLLYLSVSDMALGCMLAQLDDSGKDRVIYYLNKKMLDYETRYVMIERYYLALVWAIRRLRHYMIEYFVHLIYRLDPLRYLFDRLALVGRLMRWLVLLTECDIHYVTQKSIRGSIVAYHLASLPVSDARAIDDDFPDEDVAAVTSLSGWRMYFDGAANHSGYGIGILLISPHDDHIPRSVRLAFSDRHPATNNIVEYEACILGLETTLELEIGQMEVFGDSNLVLRQIQGEWKTRDVKLRPYHAYLELLVGIFDDLRCTHLPRAQNQFADALATLTSMIDIPVDAIVRQLLIESRSAPAYCCLIEDTEIDDGLPWYHDIYHFLRLGIYPEAATTKEKRALRQLAARFVICGETLYRRSADGMLLLCLDRASADRVMREVHAGVCGPHMGGHMLARKIMRTGYFWLTMECQIHGDLIHVEIASYARLTSFGVASFIRSHIIYRYGVSHEPISDREVHFRAEVDTLVQRYNIRHHRSSAYRPQTNGAVEAANKNIKRILRRMVETSRDWSKKLPFALWAYRTSFRTSTGATPYSLVYGMEVVLLVEIEMGSLRVALEQQIPEANWAQARFDKLNLLDERRLRAVDHVCAYQRKMARSFKKWVKPRPLHVGDLVLKGVDPRRRYMVDGFRWKPILRADQCGSTKEQPISGSILTSHHHYTYHYQFILLHLSPYRHHIHVRHPQVCYSFHYSVERYCTCSIGHYSCVVHRDKLPVERCSGFDRPISQDYSVDCYVEIVVCLLPDYSLRLSDHPYGMTMGSLGRSHHRILVGVQSHHHFLVSAIRAIITSHFDVQSHIPILAFRAIISRFRCSKPFSSHLRLAFGAIVITPQFDVHCHIPILGIHSHHHIFVRCSKSSSLRSLTFRVTFSVSAFRAIISFQFWRSEPSLSHSRFRRSEPSSLLSLTCRVTFPVLAFKAIIASSLAFRAIVITSQYRRSEPS